MAGLAPPDMKHSIRSSLLSPLHHLLIACCASGCVKTQSTSNTQVLESWTERSGRFGPALVVELTAKADSDGVIRGRVFEVSSCKDTPYQRLEITDAKTVDQGNLWLQLGIGALAAGGGAYLLINAPNYSSEPEPGAQYSPRRQAKSIGWTLAVVGGAVLLHGGYVGLSAAGSGDTRVEKRALQPITLECERTPASNISLDVAGDFLALPEQVTTNADGHFELDLAALSSLRFPARDAPSTVEFRQGERKSPKVTLGAWLAKPHREARCASVSTCTPRLVSYSQRGVAYEGVTAQIADWLLEAAAKSEGPCVEDLAPLRADTTHATIAADAESLCRLSGARSSGEYAAFQRLWSELSKARTPVLSAHARVVSQTLLDGANATVADCRYHGAEFPDDKSAQWYQDRCATLEYGIPLKLLRCCSEDLSILAILGMQRSGESSDVIAQRIEKAPFPQFSVEDFSQLRSAGVRLELLEAIQRAGDAHAKREQAEQQRQEAELREFERQRARVDCSARCQGRWQACVEMAVVQGAVSRSPANTGRCDGNKAACVSRCNAL